MKRIIFLLMTAVFSFMIFSCSSFVNVEESAPKLKRYEKKIYSLLKDIKHGGVISLKKGKKVKILFSLTDSWVKVYAYPAAEDRLKAKQTLILYLFDDDFPDAEYSEKFVLKKLRSVIK
jgi:type II secretion system-associated lipoprotein